MDLSRFDNSNFDRGRPLLVEAVWRSLEGLLFNSWIPGSRWRAGLLRLFGATIGTGVVLKPYTRIKFPWKLSVGDHSWIGEGVWIDNLDEVSIGRHCCISQGAYLCTGNHRWDRESFDLETSPIRIQDQAWVGAMARIAPGVTISEGSVIVMGSVITRDTSAWSIQSESPSTSVHERRGNAATRGPEAGGAPKSTAGSDDAPLK